MSVKVKAGSIMHLTDARYFTSKGVEWIGFCFDPDSPDFISPRDAQEIMGWLQGPAIVGEFNKRSIEEVRETALILGLKYIQCNSNCSPMDYNDLDAELIVRVDIAADTSPHAVEDLIEPWKQKAAWFLFNFIEPIKESKLNQWAELIDYNPVILQQAFTPDKLEDILSVLQPEAIQLRGGYELKKGEKQFDALDDLFERLLEAES